MAQVPEHLANARFKASLDMRVIRKDGTEEDYPNQTEEILTLEEVVKRFSGSPGFDDWLLRVLEEKTREEGENA